MEEPRPDTEKNIKSSIRPGGKDDPKRWGKTIKNPVARLKKIPPKRRGGSGIWVENPIEIEQSAEPSSATWTPAHGAMTACYRTHGQTALMLQAFSIMQLISVSGTINHFRAGVDHTSVYRRPFVSLSQKLAQKPAKKPAILGQKTL